MNYIKNMKLLLNYKLKEEKKKREKINQSKMRLLKRGFFS
jgi:hypothetical protein